MSILEEYKWPSKDGLIPFAHQKTTVGFALTNKRSLILNEMGTGKTLSVLWALDILFWKQRIRKALVVCPLSTMKSVWQREAFFNLPHLKTVVAHGSKPVRIAAIKSNAQIVIINHDGIKTCLDELVTEGFDVVAIDELTAFKSDSDRTKMTAYLCNHSVKKSNDPLLKYSEPKAVWGMTGELTPNSPLEAYSQCKVVDAKNPRIPRYFGQFRDMVMYQPSPLDHPDFWLPKDTHAHVVASMAQPAIRFARKDCIDLPPTTIIDVEVDLSPEQKAAYKSMREKLIVETSKGTVTAANAAVKLNKLLQISAGSVITSDEGEQQVHEIPCGPSLSELFRIYDETPQKKLVVFAAYRATIHMLVAKFLEHGASVECIYGDVSQNDRARHIERFQTGDLNVLILQPQSSAHGITLVAANTIVWYSLVPSNELYQQGNARIVRPGQSEKTFIYNLIRTPAEQHLSNILKRKGNMSDEVKQLFADNLF